MNKSYCSLIVLTFIITGLWDLLLQFITHNYDKMPEFVKWFDFIESLKPYFKQHTILSAILLAAFVGAIAQAIILKMHKLPTNLNSLITFLSITFIISGLVGFPMQYSGLFPILDETYYNHLGPYRGFYHDGISGLIVQITLLVLLYGTKSIGY